MSRPRIWFTFQYLPNYEGATDWRDASFVHHRGTAARGYLDAAPTNSGAAKKALRRIAENWVKGTRFRLVHHVEKIDEEEVVA